VTAPRAAALFALVLAACGPAPAPVTAPSAGPAAAVSPTAAASSSAAPSASRFDETRAFEHLRFLADPARGGRWTESPGYDEAARYLADQFAKIGLEPYGDGRTFFQRFRMPIVDLAATPALERVGSDAKRFTHRVDFTERVGGRAGSGTAEGRLVFAAGATRTTSFSDFAGVDARGAVLLVLGTGRADPMEAAIREGAAAVIFVSDRMIKFSYPPHFDAQTLPSVLVTEATADELIAGSGKRLAELRRQIDEQQRTLASGGTPAPLAFETANRVRVAVPLTPVREIEATNVVGLLRGSDPDLSKRAVLVGGHLDGVGSDPDGTVFQAANDNASGPAVTIEVARALVARRSELKHSVIFVAWAGEEQGLFGSEHYASQVAAIPGRTESLLAYLNLDVVGCCGSTLGASDESASLHGRIRRAAEAEAVPFGVFRGSSDHINFARRRVDAAQIAWGDLSGIHTLRDTVTTITADRLGITGRVTERVVLELARGG